MLALLRWLASDGKPLYLQFCLNIAANFIYLSIMDLYLETYVKKGNHIGKF